MNKLFLNKKANEQTLSIYWFVLLFIIAGAIVFGVSMLYGNPMDVRSTEASILADHIGDCISQGGKMTHPMEYWTNENVLDTCGISLNVEDAFEWDNDQIYFNISFINFNDNGVYSSTDIFKEIAVGNSGFLYLCNEGETSPVCIQRQFFVLDNNEEVLVKVFTAIRKTEKNA